MHYDCNCINLNEPLQGRESKILKPEVLDSCRCATTPIKVKRKKPGPLCKSVDYDCKRKSSSILSNEEEEEQTTDLTSDWSNDYERKFRKNTSLLTKFKPKTKVHKCKKDTKQKCTCELPRQYPSIGRNDISYFYHRRKVAEAKAYIDNKAPKIDLKTLFHPNSIANDFGRVTEITKQNANLLKLMDRIYCTKGVIDTYNPSAGLGRSLIPKILGEIKEVERKNVQMLFRIINSPKSINNKELENDWQNTVELVKRLCKYPIVLPGLIDPGVDVVEGVSSLTNLVSQHRPKVFIDLAVKDGRDIGRLTIMLFMDLVPVTCCNFYTLCANYRKQARADAKGLKRKYPHFVGSPMHRIFPNLYAEGGDITKGNGIGGMSACGEDFEEENFDVKAKYTGSVAMVPMEKGLVNSQFLITFKPLSVINGKRVVFGRVIRGISVLKSLEGCGRKHGKPLENVIISNCGISNRQIRLGEFNMCACAYNKATAGWCATLRDKINEERHENLEKLRQQFAK